MGKQQEEARAMSPAPTATIKLDSWWNHPERHGAMFDLAASEDVKLREGEVKVIPLGIRKKDAAKPIPEAAYMQRVRAIADTMPPWLARAYTASRREAAGIREL